MIALLLSASVLMAGPTTTASSEAATAPPKAARKAQFDGSKVICRNEATIGTRLPTKRCATAAQIAERQAEDRARLEKQQIVTPDNVR